MTKGSRNIILLGLGAVLITATTTAISMAIYYNSGDIYLDRSRPPFLPDDDELEQKEGTVKDKYSFSKTGTITKDVIDEYIENLNTQVEKIDNIADPYSPDDLADKIFGL